MQRDASCMIYIWQEQTLAVISEARGRRGLPPLGACVWAPPATPVTSVVGKKENRWHCNQAPYAVALTPLGTHPHSTCHCQISGQCPDTWSLSLPKTIQLGAAGTAPPSWAKRYRVLLSWPAGSRGKPPQLSLATEMGVAGHN